jgi:hypothetical protein
MSERWMAFMSWCKENPYCTIERLEIVKGEPNLIVLKTFLTTDTHALVKIRYNDGAFSK